MKVMFLNLFESFDPSIYFMFKFQFNWMFMFMPLILFCNNYWFIPSRINMLMNIFILFLFNEYSKSMHKDQNMKLISNIKIFLNLMLFIMFMNFFSLFPYIFSMTSHLLFNLSISLSLWLSFFLNQIINHPMSFFSHLVPKDSPKPLMHFMVIIELISFLIKPWTLSIRLSSNLISGHLMLILLSNFMMNWLMIMPISMLIQNILLILEISMSLIQAYVFSILLSLYLKEST